MSDIEKKTEKFYRVIPFSPPDISELEIREVAFLVSLWDRCKKLKSIILLLGAERELSG